MRLTLKILILALTTLPAVGCFGIRYRDPSLSSYEEFTDTTVTLSISGDSCSTSNGSLAVNEYELSGEDLRQQATARAPLPRFLPAPTQPVFNTRAEYEPPQAMLKVIPVKVSEENRISNSLFKDNEPRLQQILGSEIKMKPIEKQPRRILFPLKGNSPMPIKKPEENKTKPSEPNESILKVRIVQGTWQPKSK